MKILSYIFSLIKFDKRQYNLLYCIMFAFVIFETFKIASNFSLADVFFFLISLYFLSKQIRSRVHVYKNYIYLAIFFAIAIIGVVHFGLTRMFQSQLRFVFYCFVFTTILNYFCSISLSMRERLLSSYIYVCIISSAFIIVQYISFYVFHYNIKFDFWETTNAAGNYIYTSLVNFRTGGFFNEPSWYAVFTGPVLDISFRRKKYKELYLCLIGMIFSTSSLAFLFIGIFVLFHFNKARKLVFVFVLLIALLYYFFPMAFERFTQALDFGEDATNSNNARVFNPINIIMAHDTTTLLGMNIDRFFLTEGMFFANTFIFVFLTFGIFGLVVFLRMMTRHQSLCMSAILIATVIIEGCYGRPDFWMALLAASVCAVTPQDKLQYKSQITY